MTGPTYPRPPGPGTNAIGQFIIGTSPIGTIPFFDIWDTVLSQYANSPIITQLVENFFDYIDQTLNFEDFFDLIWNVDTAQGYGLDVWGRIVGVTRVVPIPGTVEFFGFEQQIEAEGFGVDSFFVVAPFSNNYFLADSAFRTLILAKALANISDGSIPSINQMLLNLFPRRGNCYVADGEDMSLVYTFEFGLTDVELAIVSLSGVLPTPTGVSFTVSAP